MIQIRLPSLDGLRAFSIIGVLYAHATISPGFSFLNNVVLHFLMSFIEGDNGVNIFFVISGFLITNLLLSEEIKNDKIDLKAFYIRRFFRILPVYFLFLLIVILCSRFALINDMDVRSFLPPLTFTTGTLPIATGWTLGHTWSLSVEEQFYLLWPVSLVLCGSLKNRNILLIASVVLIPFLRILYYYKTRNSLYYSFPVRGDAILIGCFLAVNKNGIENVFKSRLLLRSSLLVTACLTYTIQTFAQKQILGIITVPFDILVHALLAALLIIAYTILPNKKSIIYRLLNSKLFCFIGVLSYSLYIWQQFFLQKADTVTSVWKHYPWNILLVFVVAVSSYYLLEKPFLQLRKKYFA